MARWAGVLLRLLHERLIAGELMANTTWEVRMRFLTAMALCLFIAAPAVGQPMSEAEQELLRYRAKMVQDFMEAVKNKDVSLVADHYTKDAVYAGLVPTRYVLVGRDAIVKRYEELFKAGTLVDYSSKPIEVHIIGDNAAWTSGSYSYTAISKDGAKREFQGNWLDMLRREEDGHWRVSFAGYGSMPKQ
jgi:uncharacterized protein (TIGR02246 family)